MNTKATISSHFGGECPDDIPHLTWPLREWQPSKQSIETQNSISSLYNYYWVERNLWALRLLGKCLCFRLFCNVYPWGREILYEIIRNLLIHSGRERRMQRKVYRSEPWHAVNKKSTGFCLWILKTSLKGVQCTTGTQVFSWSFSTHLTLKVPR